MNDRWLAREQTVALALLVCWLCAGCGSQTPVATLAEKTGETRLATDGSATPETVVDAPPRESLPDDWFEDRTAQSGIDFAYRNGREGEQYTVLETVGGGVAALDYDQDGDMDLFFPGGGTITGSPLKVRGLPGKLYRNEGNWKFHDATAEAGLELAGDYSIGCSVGDFNGDGYPDLFVTAYGRSRLFQNLGTGKFFDITDKVNLIVDGFSSASVWADVNRDSWPDLYVAGYLSDALQDGTYCGDNLRKIKDVCGPRLYHGAQDRLFLNDQGKTFTEITSKAGLSAEGKGLGVLTADFNRDGWLDFYVANDTTYNQMYLGASNQVFAEVGALAGVATDSKGTPQGSMGIDYGDYDGDGRGDLWVTNFERESNTLYRSLAVGEFGDATLAARLAHVGRPQVGFGTGFIDFDADGWLDLYVLNGHVAYYTGQSPYLQSPLLIRNNEGKIFTDLSAKGGPYFSSMHAGRGAASVDLDNDGALDLVCVHQNAPVTLLRNRQPPKHWTRVELINQTKGAAIGAEVTVDYHGRSLVRAVVGGAGYLSCSDPRIVLPAVDHQPREVTVRWLSGKKERFRKVPVRQSVRLMEGEGDAAE
jgi:enediyne biosynthesis protein E4